MDRTQMQKNGLSSEATAKDPAPKESRTPQATKKKLIEVARIDWTEMPVVGTKCRSKVAPEKSLNSRM